MRVTIINGNAGDDKVIVDGFAIKFSVEELLPDPKIWAVQWSGDSGLIEYLDQAPQPITSLDAFAPVLEKYEAEKYKIENPQYTLEQKKEIAVAKVNRQANLNIVAGFTSSALGEVHAYSSMLDDQINISGNVQLAQLGENCVHFCYTAAGERVEAEHTPAQMLQVGRDLYAHKMAILADAGQKKAAINNAETAEDLDALQM